MTKYIILNIRITSKQTPRTCIFCDDRSQEMYPNPAPESSESLHCLILAATLADRTELLPHNFVLSLQEPPPPTGLQISMLGSSARHAARSAAPNAVRLLITPQPANLAESREILRIVQRFGEVVTYKNLKVRLHFCSWLTMRY
jgi:hypothetical protein